MKIIQSLCGYEFPLECSYCDSQIMTREFFPSGDSRDHQAQLPYRYFKCENEHNVAVQKVNIGRIVQKESRQ